MHNTMTKRTVGLLKQKSSNFCHQSVTQSLQWMHSNILQTNAHRFHLENWVVTCKPQTLTKPKLISTMSGCPIHRLLTVHKLSQSGPPSFKAFRWDWNNEVTCWFCLWSKEGDSEGILQLQYKSKLLLQQHFNRLAKIASLQGWLPNNDRHQHLLDQQLREIASIYTQYHVLKTLFHQDIMVLALLRLAVPLVWTQK